MATKLMPLDFSKAFAKPPPPRQKAAQQITTVILWYCSSTVESDY